MQFVDGIVDFLFDKVVDVNNIKHFQNSQSRNQKNLPKENIKTKLENYDPIANTSLNNISINLKSSKYNNKESRESRENLGHEKKFEPHLKKDSLINVTKEVKKGRLFGKPKNSSAIRVKIGRAHV